jgi:hypothetical protein
MGGCSELNIHLQEALAGIHARIPRPAWSEAVAEVAQKEFHIRGSTITFSGTEEQAPGEGELRDMLDMMLLEVEDFGEWDDEWEADGTWAVPSVAPGGSKKREAAEGDDDDEGGAARPSKRRTPMPDSEEKDEEDDDEEDDWKATLFYWRGELRLDAEKRQLVWGGTWVGSTGRLPSDEEFASSPNTFALTAALGKRGELPTFATTELSWPKLGGAAAAPYEDMPSIHRGTGDPVVIEARNFLAAGIKGSFKGSYLLDQGDGAGLESYRDKAQSFHIYDHQDTQVVTVAATGNTEFGRFVSAGVLAFPFDEGKPLMLTLVRRYLESDDPRAKWTTKKVVERLNAEVERDERTPGARLAHVLQKERLAQQPWKSASMRLRYTA